MKKTNPYTHKCPGVHDFEQGLNNKGDFDFRLNFYEHLEHCSLCKEAFDGYKLANVKHIKPLLKTNDSLLPQNKIKHRYHFVGYAATILLLVGSFFLFKFIADKKQYNKQMIVENDILISETIEHSGPKKLLAKSHENYWHIGENNEIKLNDQVIDLNDLNSLTLEEGNKAIIEVASSDVQLTNKIIQKLKVEKNQTVLTYSKQKVLKQMSL